MALPKLFQRIFWHNNTTPAIQEDNLNAMSKGLSDVDDRVIGLAGTIMEDVPQIQEDMEELEADMALIDTKIASATAEANRATTAANNAAASVISAGNKALVSEGWAKGTQNGTAVGSSSPYYHNNAEYFKNQARSFTPQGYQDLVDDVDSLKETLTNFEESITGEVVDSEPYVLRQGLGNLADMNLVGGSLAWNQLVVNGNFANTSNWKASAASISMVNNKFTVTPTSGSTYYDIRQPGGAVGIPAGHKLLFVVKASIPNFSNFRFAIWDERYGVAGYKDFVEKQSVFTSVINLNSISANGFYLGITQTQEAATTFELCNIIDLTQMFGSTIADYIYSLETATAGAGVAWFRKYFPNAYYAYQSGKIENVNVASRKVVGKNLVNGIESGSWGGSGQEAVNSERLRTADFIPIIGGKTYTVSATNGKQIYIASWEKNDYSSDYISFSGWQNSPYTVILSENAHYVKLMVRNSNNADIQPKDTNIQLEIGTTATSYEPYKEYTFPFDSSKQLRGIPKLVDNKLSYDGDIYTADGTVTRKYGIVDLGSLTWALVSGTTNIFQATISGKKNAASSSVIDNIICSKYITVSGSQITDDKVVVGSTGNSIIYIHDSTYTDATTFKNAMSGVYLVYELATPTTESANAYQNPQRAFSDGTEEFVDAGVQSATRDVSIPVGNNTTYQLNETLPPTEDYVDGALKFKAAISALGTDESGRTTASRAYTTGEFFYKDGKMYKVLTSIASGATFTVGTNCQQTTLFAELKALAQ